jgi:hypothetical protein
MAKNTARAQGPLSEDDRELLRICAPFRKQILEADRYARKSGIRSRFDPTQWPSTDQVFPIRAVDLGKLPTFQIYDFGLEVVSVADTLGHHAFYWPPFWDKLRKCSSEGRNPDAGNVGSYMGDRETSDYRRDEVEKVLRLWRNREHVKRPKRGIDWNKLHAKRAGLTGNRRRVWEETTAKELDYKDGESLKREMRKHRPKKS